MDWKAFGKTVAHAAIGGAAVAAVVYDPNHPATMLVPAAASAATSLLSAYSDSPVGQSVVAIMQAVLAAKKGK